MKLLTRTSYILVTTVLLIFFVGAVAFYLVLKSATEREVKEELMSRLEKISLELQQSSQAYPDIVFPAYLEISSSTNPTNANTSIHDTLLIDTLARQYKQYTVLSCDTTINSNPYHINIYSSRSESNALIERILLITSTIILLYVLLTYLLNRYMFARAWNDFFRTLEQLNHYDINRGTELAFKTSEISEFDLLNSTLREMTAKLQKDYEDIRDFTGNVSHEIQTPLTIIRQKAEQLLQTDPINKQQALLLADIQKSVSRLSNLNKTLILQTRIESKQFDRKESIKLSQLLKNQIEEFHPFLEDKKIKLSHEIKGEPSISADPMLIDILLINLLKNAIFHNIPEGHIHIALNNEQLVISNSGTPEKLDETQLFSRYTKGNPESGGLGLGLSLVKGICELYSFNISYEFLQEEHVFKLNFRV